MLTAGLTLPLWLIVAGAPIGSMLPRTEGETASEKPIVLPDAAAGRVAVLIVGFSKKSSDVTERWESRVFQDYGAGGGQVATFRVAVLESVPRLLRGFIRGRIEKNIPKEKRDSFVLLFHGEAEWKALVHFANPDDAYLVVLDVNGSIRWIGHGNPDAAGTADLKGQVDSLMRRRPSP
jgi:ATP10 protein